MTRRDPRRELSADEQERLTAGQHQAVANDLRSRGRPDLAGWVLEQIWDWEPAMHAYEAAGRWADALRVTLETGSAGHLDRVLGELRASEDPAAIEAAVKLLKNRRRPLEAARLLEGAKDPRAQAQAFLDAGSPFLAARALAEGGEPQEALTVLTRGHNSLGAEALALAARLAWDLGDAESAALFAQRCLREGGTSSTTITILARALVALGHDLAALMVLRGHGLDAPEIGVPGRYHVNGLGPPGWVGTTYVGIDRVTLEEVEIHLLLADQNDTSPLEDGVLQAMERFAASAEAGAAIGHPAIRPVLRLDPAAGILVMPRAEGPPLRSFIRSPGMVSMPSRARAWIAFLLEGLNAAHLRGFAHGWLLPSQMACDAAGRPMLGPFGAHYLSGLAATRTGTLEELMVMTAPELHRGGQPTVQSDLYAIGALFKALLTGLLATTQHLDTPEFELACALTARDPTDRPSIDDVLAALHHKVADVRELDVQLKHTTEPRRARVATERDLGPALAVTADESWSDEVLDALCQSANPWLQPILDRRERTLHLAAWPEGSRALGGPVEGWMDFVPPEGLDLDGDGAERAIRDRLEPRSLVLLPAGNWMIALDDLLTR